MRTRIVVLLVSLLSVTLLSGCGSDKKDTKPANAEQLKALLATTQSKIDGAPSLDIGITTPRLPEGVSGLLSASGKANRTPAFEGIAKVSRGGSPIESPVVSVGDDLWVKFGGRWLSINPKSFGFPSPSSIVGTAGNGISTVLTATQNLKEGDRERDGEDVVRVITGTIPGSVIAAFLPTASKTGTFNVTYRYTEDDELVNTEISGPFYGGKTVTYLVRIDTLKEPVVINPR